MKRIGMTMVLATVLAAMAACQTHTVANGRWERVNDKRSAFVQAPVAQTGEHPTVQAQ